MRKISSNVICSATNYTRNHSGLNPKLCCKKLNYCTAAIKYSYCSLYIKFCALMEDCYEYFLFFLYLTPYSSVFFKRVTTAHIIMPLLAVMEPNGQLVHSQKCTTALDFEPLQSFTSCFLTTIVLPYTPTFAK